MMPIDPYEHELYCMQREHEALRAVWDQVFQLVVFMLATILGAAVRDYVITVVGIIAMTVFAVSFVVLNKLNNLGWKRALKGWGEAIERYEVVDESQ